MSYAKLKPGMPMYDLVKLATDTGVWACDAVTHNSPRGCKNPRCFKFKPSRFGARAATRAARKVTL